MRTTSLLLVLLMTQTALAQTARIEGLVTDHDGAPIPGVNVVISGTSTGAATDTDGRYRIVRAPAGGISLVASAVGFRPATRAVTTSDGATLTVDFALEEITVQSGEVVITATRRAQVAGSAPVSVSLLTPRDVESRNLVTLDEALRYVPGVQMAGNQVNIRGSSGFSYNVGSRVLLLVDGVPLLGPDTGGIPMDALPMSQVERIEVVKGPGSALYGAGALGGVVNILTKRFARRPETSITLFAGAHDPVRYREWREGWQGGDSFRGLGGASATHSRQFGENAGMWVSAAWRTDQGYMNFNERTTFQVFSKAGWNPTRQLRMALLGGWTWSEYDSFFYWNGISDPLNPGRLDLIKEGARGANDLQTTMFSMLPVVTHIVSPEFTYTVRCRFYRGVYHPLDDQGRLREESERTVGYRAGAEVQADWEASPLRHLTFGISGDGMAAKSEFFQGSNGRLQRGQPEGAAFMQWDERLTRKLTVVGGLRYDYYQIDEAKAATRLSPKLNAAWSFNEGLTVRASFGQGFRIPSIAERFTDNQEFFPVLPNLKLRPEESTGYEAGIHTAAAFGPLGIDADIAAFWNDYRHLVEPKFTIQGGSTGFTFINLTRARIRGIEASLDAATANERGALRLGYTLLDARDMLLDQPLALRSRHLFKVAASARLVGPLEAGIDFRYASRPERFDSDFSRFVPDADVTVPVKVVDARAGVRTRRFSASIIVQNLLDYYYMERPALMAPPRQFQLVLQTRL